jgi:hypothetical protein
LCSLRTYFPQPGRVFVTERYDGHLAHAKSFRLRERLWKTHPVAAGLLARKRGRITRIGAKRAASGRSSTPAPSPREAGRGVGRGGVLALTPVE